MIPAPSPDPDPVVPGRACDGCTLCCKLLAVPQLDKPKGVWCVHCAVRAGCRIHATRPTVCREYHCGFLTLAMLSEAWRPSKCKIVLSAELDGRRLTAHVDPGRPDAWRQEPYYSQLKAWARLAAEKRNQVVVCVGSEIVVILPDKDVALGVVAEDEIIVMQETRHPTGLTLDAIKMKRSDPQAAKLITQDAKAASLPNV